MSNLNEYLGITGIIFGLIGTVLGWINSGKEEVKKEAENRQTAMKEESDARLAAQKELEHRLTTIEERSLSKEDVAEFHAMTSSLKDLVKKVDELCVDYKSTVKFIYTDLLLALKKTTSPKYDALIEKVVGSFSEDHMKPLVPEPELRKLYIMLKADYTRALKKEDKGRIVMTRLIIKRMEQDFGFGERDKTIPRCAK